MAVVNKVVVKGQSYDIQDFATSRNLAAEITRAKDAESELLKRIQGTSEESDALRDSFKSLGNFKPNETALMDALDAMHGSSSTLGIEGVYRAYNDYDFIEIVVKPMSYAQDVWLQTISGILKPMADGTFTLALKYQIYERIHQNGAWSEWKVVASAKTLDELQKQINENKQTVAELIGEAPETLDTIHEISDWITNDESGAAAMATQINENKSNLSKEIERATGAEQKNTTAISSEIERAKAEELNLKAGDSFVVVSSTTNEVLEYHSYIKNVKVEINRFLSSLVDLSSFSLEILNKGATEAQIRWSANVAGKRVYIFGKDIKFEYSTVGYTHIEQENTTFGMRILYDVDVNNDKFPSSVYVHGVALEPSPAIVLSHDCFIDNALNGLFEPSDNLAVITCVGGYLNTSGSLTNGSSINSGLIPLEPGATYYIHQQNVNNYVRIFTKSNEVYTHVEAYSGDKVVYDVPNDGNEYWLQFVENVNIDGASWVSKDVELSAYVPPIVLKENRVIRDYIDTAHTELGTAIANEQARATVVEGQLQAEIAAETARAVAAEKANADAIAINKQEIGEVKELLGTYNKIRLLVIGNSHSRDVFSYLPFILEQSMGVDVTLGILYRGSCNLEIHYDNILNNLSYSNFDLYQSIEGKWNLYSSNATIDRALSTCSWDIVIMQQQSNKARDYSTFQPYLNNIVDLLFEKLGHPVKLGWHLSPAYADGYSGLETEDSNAMFTEMSAAAKRVIEETGIEFIVPGGTAIQNARNTSLVSIGDGGGLTFEGLHLQEGLPCLLGAYAAAMAIYSLYDNSKSVFGNALRPTQEDITAWNIPQQHGTVVGITEENVLLAQKCAIAAFRKPFDITTVNF